MNRFISFLFLLAAGIAVSLPLACNSKLPASPANALGGPSPTPCLGCGPAASSSANGNYTFKLSWNGPVTSQFSDPYGILLVGGNVWTTDETNALAQVDTENGTFQKNVYANGNFSNPECLTKQGSKVYIADSGDNAIIITDLNGNYLGQIFNPGGFSLGSGSSNGGPDDVAVDSHGDVFVTAANPCNIYKIKPDGTVQVISNSCSDSTGSVWNPTGIALDNNENVLVMDQLSTNSASRIVTYNNNGDWQSERYGFGNTPFSSDAENIRVDSSNHIFVSDINNAAIYKGDESGNLLAVIGNGILSDPIGLAVEVSGGQSRVFVADDNYAAVGVFTGPN
jgi:streptogramin lyase